MAGTGRSSNSRRLPPGHAPDGRPCSASWVRASQSDARSPWFAVPIEIRAREGHEKACGSSGPDHFPSQNASCVIGCHGSHVATRGPGSPGLRPRSGNSPGIYAGVTLPWHTRRSSHLATNKPASCRDRNNPRHVSNLFDEHTIQSAACCGLGRSPDWW